MIRIAIDDTDSADGGCTTYLALEVISRLAGWLPYGYPRLVRLNPNVPWKTRGNGAIAIRLIHEGSLEDPAAAAGSGQDLIERQIGAIGTEPVYGYFPPDAGKSTGIPDYEGMVTPDGPGEHLEGLLEVCSSVVEEHSKLEDPKTNSGVVVGTGTPGSDLYWKAVREVVELSYVDKILTGDGFYHRGWKNRRGLIGATAALGWDPTGGSVRATPSGTFELITYRESGMWGTERRWVFDSAKELDKAVPGSFDNYDHVNGLPRIAPHTKCPVFYGVRGTDATVLPKALEVVEPNEAVDRWMIFETNHATDDHLQVSKFGSFSAHQSVIIEGKVSGLPCTLKGGHTFVKMQDDAVFEGGSIILAAYEPTKEFREHIRGLRAGDRIVAYGGLRNDEVDTEWTGIPTLNLEKLKVLSTAENLKKIRNPVCATCGKGMKSMGKDRGYRCKKCGVHIDEDAVELIPEKRTLEPGFYEVPVCARRHLSTPLSMIADPEH